MTEYRAIHPELAFRPPSLLAKLSQPFLLVTIVSRILFHMAHMAYFNQLAKRHVRRHGNLSKEKRFEYMSRWAKVILKSSRVPVQIRGIMPTDSGIVVANHLGFLDIPMLLQIAPLTFVLKDELRSWPILGTAAKLSSYIFVKRERADSRQYTAAQIAKKVLQDKELVLIFPSGTTGLAGTTPWKHGSFRIAKENGLRIYPARLTFEPVESATFINDDLFLPTLMRFFRNPPKVAILQVFPPETITDVEADCARIQRLCEGPPHKN